MSERFESVTAILSGGVPKPALPSWAAKRVAEEAARFILDASLALPDGDGGEYPRESCTAELVVQHLKGAPWRESRAAADLGSQIHRYVEAMNLGRPKPRWPLAVAPFMAQFERFLAVHRPEIEAAEMRVYNRTHGYAGTLDALVRLDGQLCVLDCKTGRGIYGEVGLQLAAYARAEFCVLDPSHPGTRQITPGRGRRWYEWAGPPEDEHPLPSDLDRDTGYVLHLRPDSYELRPVRIDEEVFEAFLAAMEVDRFCSRVSREVIGQAVTPVTEEVV